MTPSGPDPAPAPGLGDGRVRCGWARGSELERHYHDTEWGTPNRDDVHLFEMLTLEGAQAGLSWHTILAKRDRYREVFAGFDPAVVARFDADDQIRLLADPGIVRNRLKVASTITNANAYLRVQEEHGSFAAYLWGFVDGRPLQSRRVALGDLPARTEVSDRLSKDLKRRGFSFVGSTIVYALMQACGLVNDHVLDCFRHDEVAALG